MSRFVFEDEKFYDVTKNSTDGFFRKGFRVSVFTDGSVMVDNVYEGKVDCYSRYEVAKWPDERMDFEARWNEDYILIDYNPGMFVTKAEYKKMADNAEYVTLSDD